jgi:uncharacterized protein (TIGR02284 family)
MNALDNKELIETLNDLVKINHDRVEGYEKASKQATDNPVLNKLFENKASDSRAFSDELQQYIAKLGGGQITETTVSGKIFRGWMDVKNAFKPSDQTTILDSCEFGEDAALRAYDMALKSDAELDAELRKKIIEHKDSIESSHNQIKQQRDLSANMSK